jgi:ABC-2 type transport system permease protein
LAAGFTAIGIFASALSANPIISFLLAAFLAFITYKGFSSFAALSVFKGGADFWLALLGIEEHYKSMSRGVVTIHDLTYFLVLTSVYLQFAIWQTAQFTR